MKDRFDFRKHPVYGVGPKEFLGLVDSAECVFTNSFHGMAISVVLQRDFFIEFSSDTNSRLINLTDLLELKDRIVKDAIPHEREINYKNVNKILEREKAKSKKYLNMVLR